MSLTRAASSRDQAVQDEKDAIALKPEVSDSRLPAAAHAGSAYSAHEKNQMWSCAACLGVLRRAADFAKAKKLRYSLHLREDAAQNRVFTHLFEVVDCDHSPIDGSAYVCLNIYFLVL